MVSKRAVKLSDDWGHLARSSGRRSLVAAICVATILFLFILSSPGSQPDILSAEPIQTSPEQYQEPPEKPSEKSHEQLQEQEQPQPSQPSPAANPANPASPKCSVKKVSMLYGAHKFVQLEQALETHQQHCLRWGCELESLDRDLTGRKLYSKHYFLISKMLEELAKHEEDRRKWLLWVDADSIIVNPGISPCAFLPPDHVDNVHALVTADHNGLNNGIFYLKVHPSSLDLLTQVIAYPLAHPEEDLGWFGEQAAMAHVINATETRHEAVGTTSEIAWVPRDWFNNYEFEHGFEGKPGSFLVHFAGLAETRLQHMANWLTELGSNQAKWEIPVEETPYKDSIPEFWRKYADGLHGKTQAT